MNNCNNFKIINNGKCTICGKDLDENRLFVCETCSRLNDLTELLDSDKKDLTDDVIKILNKNKNKIEETVKDGN